MKVAVLQFPGSNCDQDALFSLRDDMGMEAEYVWHQQESLAGFDAAFVPGGFSYGDYLRCGAIAARSPVMKALVDAANEGMPVIGACNGFQILCESGLLPGALQRNESLKFVCRWVGLEPAGASRWTRAVKAQILLPIAHAEGRYFCSQETLEELHANGQIAFYYRSAGTGPENPNGSLEGIAGVTNRAGNVLGLMPHPERATKPLLGGTDGKFVLEGLKRVS